MGPYSRLLSRAGREERGELGESGRQVIEDVVVGDPDDAEAVRGEEKVAPAIVVGLALVDRTVDFDDEAGSVAVNVNDEAADDLLTTEVEFLQAVAAEGLSEESLRRGHAAPRLAGLLD